MGLRVAVHLLGREEEDLKDLDSKLFRESQKLFIPRRKGVLESSASSSQRHSHFPKSSGMPHSASTIMGSGVSLARTLRYSGLA